MADFLHATFAFPTAIFTLLLGLVVVYWLLVVAGALDLELFNAPDELNALGIRDVPLTIWVSLFVLVGWVTSLFAVRALGPVAGGLLAVVASFVATTLAVRPMRRLFAAPGAVEHRALVGKTCTVTTLRVDGGFGQALIDDGAAGLLVQVRCPDANDLTQGARALIFDYNPEEGTFHVARYEEPTVE